MSISLQFLSFCFPTGRVMDRTGIGQRGMRHSAGPFSPLYLSHKTLPQPSQTPGLPLHFLVTGSAATPKLYRVSPSEFQALVTLSLLPETVTDLRQRWTKTCSNTNDMRYQPTTEIDCA